MAKTPTKNRPPSTQEHLAIAHIADGVVVTKEGDLRIVLGVTAVNFELKSEQEQSALIFQYQGFLNSLTFPLQIVMQSRQLDLTKYIQGLEGRATQSTNELLRGQIIDYIEFIKRLITIANIMDKKFYCVISFSPPNIKKRGLFDRLFHPAQKTPLFGGAEFKAYKEELVQRSNLVITGLGSLGLRAEALSTPKLIELYYNTYNQEEAGKEKLVADEELEAPLVQREETPAKTPEAK